MAVLWTFRAPFSGLLRAPRMHVQRVARCDPHNTRHYLPPRSYVERYSRHRRRGKCGLKGRWGGMCDMTCATVLGEAYQQSVMTSVFPCEFLQQCLRLQQVSRVKSFGEPVVHRCQQLTGCGAFALALPQATQAHGGAQLQGLGFLAVSNVEGLVKAGFGCLGRVRDSLLQQ